MSKKGKTILINYEPRFEFDGMKLDYNKQYRIKLMDGTLLVGKFISVQWEERSGESEE